MSCRSGPGGGSGRLADAADGGGAGRGAGDRDAVGVLVPRSVVVVGGPGVRGLFRRRQVVEVPTEQNPTDRTGRRRPGGAHLRRQARRHADRLGQRVDNPVDLGPGTASSVDSWSSCTATGRPRSPELGPPPVIDAQPLAPSPPEVSPLVSDPASPVRIRLPVVHAGRVQVPTVLPRVAAAAALNGTRTNVSQSTSSRMPVSSSVRLSKQDSFVAMAVDSTQGCMLLCRAFRIQPRFLYVAMT